MGPRGALDGSGAPAGGGLTHRRGPAQEPEERCQYRSRAMVRGVTV